MKQEVKLTPGFPRKGIFFEDLRADMSQSVETQLDVVETWLTVVRLKVDDPYFLIPKKYLS